MSHPRRREEDAVQCAVCLHLQIRALPGVVFFAVPNGGLRAKTEAARMKATGTKAGAPDLVIVRDGKFYGLEVKAERGRLSGAQAAMLADLEAAGASVSVAHGLDEALDTLERWGLIRPSASSVRAVEQRAAAAG
jgi:hypothetical protein